MIEIESNPYQSPQSKNDPIEVKSFDWMSVASIVLWGAGFFFFNLLNGQHYTNRMIFLACILCSTVIWIWQSLKKDSSRQVFANLLLVVHLLFFVVVSSGLQKAYEKQQQFNEMIERITGQDES